MNDTITCGHKSASRQTPKVMTTFACALLALACAGTPALAAEKVGDDQSVIETGSIQLEYVVADADTGEQTTIKTNGSAVSNDDGTKSYASSTPSSSMTSGSTWTEDLPQTGIGFGAMILAGCGATLIGVGALSGRRAKED